MSGGVLMQRRRGAERSSWPRVRLGEVCAVVYGERIRKIDSTANDYPVYGGGGETFRWATYNRENACVVSRFAMSRECVRYVQGRFFLNDSGLTVEVNNSGLLQEFLNWFLLGKQDAIYSLGQGAAQRNLNTRRFVDLIIPLPPLADQRRIASTLDSICGIIEKRKDQLAQLQQLVKSRFVEMFGDADSFVAIGDRFETQSGGTPKSTEREYYENGTIPWLTSGDVGQGIINKVDRYITQSGFDNSSTKWTPIDSVLVAMYGATAGKVGLLKVCATTNQAVCSILPVDGMMPEFVYYAVASKTDWMIQQAAGGAQPNISQGVVRKMQIPNPPLALQREFASFVAKVDKLAFAVRKSLETAEKLYRQQLSKAFS